jgi:hypothetical protein
VSSDVVRAHWYSFLLEAQSTELFEVSLTKAQERYVLERN